MEQKCGFLFKIIGYKTQQSVGLLSKVRGYPHKVRDRIVL